VRPFIEKFIRDIRTFDGRLDEQEDVTTIMESSLLDIRDSFARSISHEKSKVGSQNLETLLEKITPDRLSEYRESVIQDLNKFIKSIEDMDLKDIGDENQRNLFAIAMTRDVRRVIAMLAILEAEELPKTEEDIEAALNGIEGFNLGNVPVEEKNSLVSVIKKMVKEFNGKLRKAKKAEDAVTILNDERQALLGELKAFKADLTDGISAGPTVDNIVGLEPFEKRRLDRTDFDRITAEWDAGQLRALLSDMTYGRASFAIPGAKVTPDSDGQTVTTDSGIVYQIANNTENEVAIGDIDDTESLRRIIMEEQTTTGIIYQHKLMPVVDQAINELREKRRLFKILRDALKKGNREALKAAVAEIKEERSIFLIKKHGYKIYRYVS